MQRIKMTLYAVTIAMLSQVTTKGCGLFAKGPPGRDDLRVGASYDLHAHGDETGAFEASIGNNAVSGNLARRPKSDDPWDLHWSQPTYRWTTDAFDYAVALYGIKLSDAGLRAVQKVLSFPTDYGTSVASGPTE